MESSSLLVGCRRLMMLLILIGCSSLLSSSSLSVLGAAASEVGRLSFGRHGKFKILQVADMHYANEAKTPCENMYDQEDCSIHNTTGFVQRMIRLEKPDFVVFTGDNIFGSDATDAHITLNAAFAPVINAKLPWAAVLGNHAKESTLTKEGVMKHIVGMKHTVAQLNPLDANISDGFGNYNLEVGGVHGSKVENKSLLNLYFLDSGDYSKVPTIRGYDWIKPSQQSWFQKTSTKLQKAYMKNSAAQEGPAPGLAYFHIPLPEYASSDSTNFTGVKLEGVISSASVNSGFFDTMFDAGDVKAVFTGHDHRARVVLATLEQTKDKTWGAVKSISTWKRLDDGNLTAIDHQILWSKK